ncbi:MAG: zinc ribbon domain-containing protein [Chloroflexi bacterium]|nr:zinc ribbon domain-containing protein [Chloroflexota bacterium]
MKCPSCGNENPPQALFCARCGVGLTRAPEPSRSIPTRDLGQLVSETFKVYRRSFWPFLAISFVASIPALLLNVVPQWWLSLVLLVPAVFFLVLGEGAAIHAVGRQRLGHAIDIQAAYERAWQKAGPLGIATLVFLLLLLGLILIVVGIPLLPFFWVSFAFYVQAIMLEGKGATAALGRSRQLVRGGWWRVFGICVVLFLIVVGLSAALAIPGFLVSLSNETLAGVLVNPIIYIGLTLLYLDLRVRKESYGLETLASEMGRSD